MEKIANCGQPVRDFNEASGRAIAFLANPWKLWTFGQRDDQRTVLKLTFTDKLAQLKNKGLEPHLSF